MKNDDFIVQVEEIKERLYRIAYLYLNSRIDAVDAVDEAIFNGYVHLKQLKEEKFFKTWITRILINVCKKELKHKKRIGILSDGVEEGYEQYDSLPLREAINKLPDELKVIVNLRYFNDYTVVETAEILKLPQGTVATRQRKALSLLRLELEEDE